MSKNYLIVIVLCFLLSSCQKSEIFYSCDPIKDQWVKSNLKEIANMSSDEWFDLDMDYARPAYIALKPTTKYLIWNKKLTQTLALDWSEDEKLHIEKVLKFIKDNKEIFNDNASQDDIIFEKVTVFLYSWYEYGKEILKWDDNLIASIISDAHPVIDKTGKIDIKINGLRAIATRSETTLECNCNLTSIWYSDCVNVDCRRTLTGCGGLTFFNCDGRHED